MTTKHVLVVLALLSLASGAALADPKVVYLKGGRQFTGEVTKTADGGYEIKTARWTVIVSADQVLRVAEAVSPEDELKSRLTKAGESPDAIYRVAMWARGRKMLREARDLLGKVLQLKPDHENAALMRKLVELELAKTTRPADSRPPTTQGAGSTGKTVIDPSLLLTMDDIHRIRLLELVPSDRVSVEFRNKVLDRFIESMEGQDIFERRSGERRFRKWPRVRQVMYILDNTRRQDTAIRDDIIVKTDPAVMKVFRSRMWPIVRASCASPTCHGGAKGAGALRVFDLPMTDDRVAYTNFYILQAWQKKGRWLINRDDPSSSMLLQCGLPRKIAKPGLGHPGKELSPPPFVSQRDRNYDAARKWIRSLRAPLLPPGYRVGRKIPGLDVKTPSTSPSTPE